MSIQLNVDAILCSEHDGSDHPDVAKLASLGAHGAFAVQAVSFVQVSAVRVEDPANRLMFQLGSDVVAATAAAATAATAASACTHLRAVTIAILANKAPLSEPTLVGNVFG